MVRGYRMFVCRDCGARFRAPDIELNAGARSMPMPCPRCGSRNTHSSILSSLKLPNPFRLTRR